MAKPKIFRHSHFNIDALLALAGAIRNQPCLCDTSKPPLAGSLNWAVVVTFNDGVEWIFRSPRPPRHGGPSDDLASDLVASEVATLKYIRSHSSIPVPEVFAYCASRENEIEVPYILMSKALGHPLSEYDWFGQPQPPPKSAPPCRLRSLSEMGRMKIMRQLGAIASQLWHLRLDKIGSLFQDSHGNHVVGKCLSPCLTWQARDSLDGINRGPFADENDYVDSLISAYTSHAKELPLTPHAFFAPIPDPSEYPSWDSFKVAVGRWNDFVAVGQKIDHSKNRLAYCIVGQLLHEMMPSLCRASADQGFPLNHPDLHPGNIFVDDDLTITCIIDWGSTASAPVTELLATPLLPRTSVSPEQSLVSAFRAGFDQATDGETIGREVWEPADLMGMFQRLVRMLSTQDYHLFAALHKQALALEGHHKLVDIPLLFYKRAQREENKQLLCELSEDDLPQNYVEKQEREAFGRPEFANMAKIAVARKLTLMSEIRTEGFVADKRLWRWIEDALGCF